MVEEYPTKSVYELNINYNDALLNKKEDLYLDDQVQKILAAHSILLTCVGVPAIYYHSLLGSRNDYKGLEESGINRRINREKLEFNRLVKELNEDKRRSKIFNGLKNLINLRKNESAFSPYANQETLELGNDIFALVRENKSTSEKITFILNVTAKDITVNGEFNGVDIITGKKITNTIELPKYGFVWIKNK